MMFPSKVSSAFRFALCLITFLCGLTTREAFAACPPCPADAPFCTDGLCVGCRSDSDCPSCQMCNPESSTCSAPVSCMTNGDCSTGQVCSTATNLYICANPDAFFGCYTDAECSSGERCIGGFCYRPPAQCESDADCSVGAGCNIYGGGCYSTCPNTPSYCDAEQGHCMPGTRPSGGCAIGAPRNHGPSLALLGFLLTCAFVLIIGRRRPFAEQG
jgi:Cys-rich repeat protein